jgi:hypothetical protein
VRVLFVSFVRIRDNGEVRGNGGVGLSSYISDIFDTCIEIFESTIEFCIAGEVGDRMLMLTKGEGCEDRVKSRTMVCKSITKICGKGFLGEEYSIFFRSKMFCILLLLLLFMFLLLLLLLFMFLLSKRNLRISEFLFKGLVFLMTSLGLSILLNSDESMNGRREGW